MTFPRTRAALRTSLWIAFAGTLATACGSSGDGDTVGSEGEAVTLSALRNPGFEARLSGWNNLGNASAFTQGAYRGTYSVRIGAGEGGVSQRASGVSPGTTYVMTAVGKVDVASEKGWVGFTFYDANGNMLGDDIGVAVTGTTWATYTVTGTAPAGAARVKLWAWKDAGSSFLRIDDFAVAAQNGGGGNDAGGGGTDAGGGGNDAGGGGTDAGGGGADSGGGGDGQTHVFTGVTPAMWEEIEAARVRFGDPNDCHAKINAIPTTGFTLSPCSGNCINSALSSQSTVILKGGTYKISSTLDIGSKKLVGAPGEQVILDAAGVDVAATLDAGVISNVTILNAENYGIQFGSNGLAYLVSVGKTGWSTVPNDTGDSFSIYKGQHNCLVSTEAYDGYNEIGQGVTANGGQANGYTITETGAFQNTVIDSHAYRISDDGFDYWNGQTVYMYFCSAFDTGKTTSRPAGDGNGVKLGGGSSMHYLYKVKSYNNIANGFDINGNSIPSTLVQCSASGNGGQDFVGVVNTN